MDALLAQFALEEKAKNSADVREDVPAPSARVYASFTAHSTSVSPGLFKVAHDCPHKPFWLVAIWCGIVLHDVKVACIPAVMLLFMLAAPVIFSTADVSN